MNTLYMKNYLRGFGRVAMILGVLATACQSLFGGGSSYVAANTTYDPTLNMHGTVVRTNDAAITTRHLLWKQGATAGGIAICGAADTPLGTVDNEESGTGKPQTVFLLGKGGCKKMVASETMATLGVPVYAAANGKIALTGSVQVGTLQSAASGDGAIVIVNDANCALARSHHPIFAGTHSWAGGSATTDAKTLTGLLATDVVVCTLRARASTETLVLAVPTSDTLTFTLGANGTNTTTKIDYAVFRAG